MRLVSERLDKDDKSLQAHAEQCTDSRARTAAGRGDRVNAWPVLFSIFAYTNSRAALVIARRAESSNILG